MLADYTCPECHVTKEIKFNIKEGPPKEVLCDHCHIKMNRVFSSNILVPDWFGDDLTTTITEKMKHGKRPTGKEKILY